MKLFIALIMVAFSFASVAQTKVVSIDAFDMSYVGGLSFKHDEGRDEDRDTTTFRLNVNYAQNFQEYVGLMWKGRAYWNRIEEDFGGNDLTSEFGVGGGLLMNFQPEDIKNSIMASGLVGVERATYEFRGAKDDEAGFNLLLTLEAGKRFDLGTYAVANISYAPTISLEFKRYGGDIREEFFKSSRDLKFNFLKFDILF